MDRSLDQQKTAGESGLVPLQSRASQGDADAQFSLGLHFGSATGSALDLAQAAGWYRKAADQDHALAQFNLGVMFTRGQGVPHDEVMAAAWMRKAAEGGDAGGQYDLGSRCHRASGGPRFADGMESRVEAYKWFHLAAAQGYRDSGVACQRVAVTMTQAEFEEGNRRAAAFVPRVTASPQMQ